MCLAIPGQIVAIHDDATDFATVDVSGVRRRISIGLLEGQDVQPGDWVLIHVGFAMSKIGEEQAREQMRMLMMLGESEAAIEEIERLRPDAGRADRRKADGRRQRRAMKFVDEFRDPALIMRTARRDPPAGRSRAAVPASWKSAAGTRTRSTASG